MVAPSPRVNIRRTGEALSDGRGYREGMDEARRGVQPNWGIGIALGVGVGVAFGVALGNIWLGIAFGAALGVSFAMAFGRRTRARPKDQGDGPDDDTDGRGP